MKIITYRPFKNGKVRKPTYRIDPWDTWSMDDALAPIIVPMLKQLKKTKQGLPGDFLSQEYSDLTSSSEFWAEGKRGPLHKKTSAMFKEGERKWNAALDEMIWAFTQLTKDWESQFHSGRSDIQWKDIPGSDCKEMVRGPRDTSKFDKDGYRFHTDRMQAGFRLFGEHFMSLWD